jgi:putative acetyltransferase
MIPAQGFPANMNVRSGQSSEIHVLVDIWLRSVRATHGFLSEQDIAALEPVVREQVLPKLEVWVLCDEEHTPIGFMALNGNSLEGLFVDPSHIGAGGGRLLLEHARRLKGALLVDVNEQNPAALRFYLANGFEVIGRSETDSGGRPFPLLHLREAGRPSS